VERIQGVLEQFPEVEKALLYGSRAKGTYRPGSDIDLTLCGSGLGLTQLARIE
jgi:predicted nucleotidyltransferase